MATKKKEDVNSHPVTWEGIGSILCWVAIVFLAYVGGSALCSAIADIDNTYEAGVAAQEDAKWDTFPTIYWITCTASSVVGIGGNSTQKEIDAACE